MNLVAVLSSTVINVSGNYDVEVGVDMPDIKGLTHFVGHPDTRKVIESLGAVYAGAGELFKGLEVGESFIAVPLANPDRSSGWTVDQALKSVNDLRVTLITRKA